MAVANKKDFLSEFLDTDSKEQKIQRAVDALWSQAAHHYTFDCPPLDITIGMGIQSGKVYEFHGEWSSGKSTLALEATKAFAKYWEAKKHKKYAILWIESESAFHYERAKYMGCPVDNILICQAETVEDGAELISATLKKAETTDTKFIIVWDSIAAASTRNELNPKINKDGTVNNWSGGMTEKPRLIRQMFRKITGSLGRTDSALVLVNQTMQTMNPYGPQYETTGGGGIKFHASARSHLVVKDRIKELRPDGTEVTKGQEVEIHHIKNKLTLPQQKCRVVMMGETGIDRLETALKYLSANRVITVSKSWKQIDYPSAYAAKGKPADMVSLKYQSNSKVKEVIELQHPHLKEWMDYLIYKQYTTVSPFVKIGIIDKIWEYEIKFFGAKQTQLTELEKQAAVKIKKELIDPMADAFEKEEKEEQTK
jgi:recombination protein RecA